MNVSRVVLTNSPICFLHTRYAVLETSQGVTNLQFCTPIILAGSGAAPMQ